MFLSTFEKLRNVLFQRSFIVNFIHIGRGVWGSDFGSCSFTICNSSITEYSGQFKRLFDKQGSVAHNDELNKRFFENKVYLSTVRDFKKIPGSPIAYWAGNGIRNVFEHGTELGQLITIKQGMATSDNNRFLRAWFEVSYTNIAFDCKSLRESEIREEKWYPYNKGGDFRKWYGNNDLVLNWWKNGSELKEFQSTLNQGWHVRLKSRDYYFKPSITWTFVSSAYFGVRYSAPGFIFDVGGSSAFPDEKYIWFYTSYLCSNISYQFLKAVNPTLNFQVENVAMLPVSEYKTNLIIGRIDSIAKRCVALSKSDWDSYETSWDFTRLLLLNFEHNQSTLKAIYEALKAHWHEITLEMQQLEEENNRIFIDAYGLQDELTPDVPLSEITLTCNPHYRYGGDKTEDELETLLLTDTMKELISYAIGCMMGRYSLDHPGLIYAHSGNKDFNRIYSSFNIQNPKSKIQNPRFPPDDDGIIPIMDQDWFPDDAANRFVEFLNVAWSPESLEENLKFIAGSLKPKNNEEPTDTIRRYLSTGFFKDHIRTYKKRPIYWLFSSGRHKAFECLVYLHRYNESTLSRMRSAYVTPLQGKLSAKLEYLQNEKNAATTASSQRKIQKEIDVLKNKQTELSAFDDELRHYADMKISLDLDDGVKVNYGKFGNLLSEKNAITGKK